MPNNRSIQINFFIKMFVLILLHSIIIMPTISKPIHAQHSPLAEAPIFIDNKPVKTKYIMREGHLLVPALFLKHTGVRVDRNQAYHSVVFSNDETTFALPIGKAYSDDYIRSTGTWRRSPLATETIEIDGQVFIPFIDVVKKFGMDAKYDPKISRTYVTTNIPPARGIIYKGNTAQRLVALTFDDGPDPYYTPKILDILKQKHVKATFFVLGKQVEQFPNLMKRIVNEGHGIANHTWNHPRLPNLTTSELIKEITSTQKIMENTVNRKPDLFRPPYGDVTKSDLFVLDHIGFRVVGWSVDTLDWSGKSASEILATIESNISPGGIILQHNFQSKDRKLDGTVEALPNIIDNLRKKGYQFVTVQTLLDNSR